MDIVKASFINNRDTEIQRLIHTAKQVWSGFYVRKGYKVLPYPIKGDISTIYFPESGFSKIPEIDRILKRVKLDFPIKYSVKMASQIQYVFKKTDISTYQSAWQKVENDFWSIATTLFPNEMANIKSLEIRITRYGSISSYKFLGSHKSQDIIIYLRNDADISHIAEAVLICLATNIDKYDKDWEKNKQFADFLLRKTDFSRLFPDYKTVKFSKSSKSQKYIKELGSKFPIGFTSLGKKIYLENVIISNRLSITQFKILQFMLQNERYFIDQQKISELLWNGEEGKFSLWAVEKTMQRLRKKLIELGANKDCITTLRKRGYLLNN